MTGPRDPRAERRALIRLHHPDAGGDPEAFARLLAAVDTPVGSEHHPRSVAPTVFTGRLGGGRWRRLGRRAVTRVRVTLPRRLPGSRRYAQI